MKIKILGMVKFENNRVTFPLVFDKGVNARVHHYRTEKHGVDTWERQKAEPVYISQELGDNRPHIWAFKSYAIQIEDIEPHKGSGLIMTDDDIKIHIKHFIYKKEANFAKLRKEVERFEQFDKLKPIYREQIPEEVRMFVWRRDEGKCVKCGSQTNLEFDHIIPISKGGSNTERNIQLLCEKCNREKRDII